MVQNYLPPLKASPVLSSEATAAADNVLTAISQPAPLPAPLPVTPAGAWWTEPLWTGAPVTRWGALAAGLGVLLLRKVF